MAQLLKDVLGADDMPRPANGDTYLPISDIIASGQSGGG